jgi:thiamine-monophosphate kinase
MEPETAFIQKYLAPLTSGEAGTLGLHDDAAVLSVPDGHELVVTTDAVAAGVHFFPDDSAGDIAWKALAVNVSDLIAKGATPLCYQMALAFTTAPPASWMQDFADGLARAQKAFGLFLSGGDTDVRNAPLSITITAFGQVPKGRMIQRSTAKAGDRLYVTGSLGDSALGLMLRHDPSLAKAWTISDEQRLHLAHRYLRPEPRVELTAALLECASAAMDISDGLAQDLGKLCAASGVGAIVDGARIPLSDAAKTVLVSDADLFQRVLSGGDDYEVLAAIPPARTMAFESAARAAHVAVREIGALKPGRDVVFNDKAGNPIAFDQGGWDHFRERGNP